MPGPSRKYGLRPRDGKMEENDLSRRYELRPRESGKEETDSSPHAAPGTDDELLRRVEVRVVLKRDTKIDVLRQPRVILKRDPETEALAQALFGPTPETSETDNIPHGSRPQKVPRLDPADSEAEQSDGVEEAEDREKSVPHSPSVESTDGGQRMDVELDGVEEAEDREKSVPHSPSVESTDGGQRMDVEVDGVEEAEDHEKSVSHSPSVESTDGGQRTDVEVDGVEEAEDRENSIPNSPSVESTDGGQRMDVELDGVEEAEDREKSVSHSPSVESTDGGQRMDVEVDGVEEAEDCENSVPCSSGVKSTDGGQMMGVVVEQPEFIPDAISRVSCLKNYKSYRARTAAPTPELVPEWRKGVKYQKFACTNNRVNTNNGAKLLCRDCIQQPTQLRNADRENFCRFKNFRLFFNDGSSDFLDPRYDVDDEGMKLWLPVSFKHTRSPRVDAAKLILTHASDTFCRVVQEERAVLKAFEELPVDIRAREGVVFKQLKDVGRETCDVCETTIFNYHWVCPVCGFAVCIDCWFEAEQGKQDRPWAQCLQGTSSQEVTKMDHDGKKFLLVQNIPGSILYDVNGAMHSLRHQLGIDGNCGCDIQKNLSAPVVVEEVELNISEKVRAEEKMKRQQKREPLKGFMLEAAKNRQFNLRLLEPSKRVSLDAVMKNLNLGWRVNLGLLEKDEENEASLAPKTKQSCTSKCSHPVQGSLRVAEEWEAAKTGRKACSFLCNGDLLCVEAAAHGQTQCVVMFQRAWRSGQPVLVVGVNRQLTEQLWTPETFSKHFGRRENELIDSLTGRTLAPRPMKVFWDGFADYKKRMLDSCHRPMLLKLKDWPPSADFKNFGKKWFDDIMRAFPMSDYTARDGHLNLAWYLPERFIRPDLGPKMYVAYGSAIHPSVSSTNLHLDVSDASNVMAYVGACSEEKADAWRDLDAAVTAGCDMSVLKDIAREGRRPGALWHIYDSKDAPKIRELLDRVRREQNLPLDSHSDPIHDQQTYLDETLRNRLRVDYGVVGYSFVQCFGDAVFIPAGAPHQVRNLMNCIKVAEDFVSAETVSHCYSLMKDFRRLSDNHTNHEDKLQIKNMVYHAVKSSIFALQKPAHGGRARRQERTKPSA